MSDSSPIQSDRSFPERPSFQATAVEWIFVATATAAVGLGVSSFVDGSPVLGIAFEAVGLTAVLLAFTKRRKSLRRVVKHVARAAEARLRDELTGQTASGSSHGAALASKQSL